MDKDKNFRIVSVSRPLVKEVERKRETRMTELLVAATHPKEQGWCLPRTPLPKKSPQPERRQDEFH